MKNILLLTLFLFTACAKHQDNVSINGYTPLSQLTNNSLKTKLLNKKEVKVWAYIDYENISTCGMANWYFSIKPDRFDEDSIHVNTPASYDFAELYNDLRDKDIRDKNKKVFIHGKIRTFDNSSNLSSMIGIEIDVKEPSNIYFK